MNAADLSEVLRSIRGKDCAGATESDALAIVNALACQFKGECGVGDALTTCALEMDDELNNTQAPTLDDVAALAEFRRRDLVARGHEKELT